MFNQPMVDAFPGPVMSGQEHGLRRPFLLSILLLSLMLASALGWMAYVNVVRLQHSHVVAVRTKLLNDHVNGLYQLLVELNVTYSALLEGAASSPTSRATIDKAREGAKALLGGVARLDEASRDDPNQIQTMAAVSALETLRGRIDRALTQPLSERDPALGQNFLRGATAVIDLGTRTWQTVLRTNPIGHPTVRDNATLKYSMWIILEAAGQEQENIAAALATRSPPTRDQLATSAASRGKIDVLWPQVETLLATGSGQLGDTGEAKALKAALALSGRAYFTDFRALADQLTSIATRAASAKPPVTAVNYGMSDAEWISATSPQLASFGDVLLTASAFDQSSTSTLVDTARWDFIFVSSLLLAAIVFAAMCAFIVPRRVLSPIDELATAADRIVHLDLGVTVPGLERTDSIGVLARATEVFKANTLAKSWLEAEAAARTTAERSQGEFLDAERAFQKELTMLVDAASTGDFSRRVDLAGKSELMTRLGEGMNRWAETVNKALVDVAFVMSAFAQGDLTKRIGGDYTGVLLQLQTDANRMGAQMGAMADSIATAATAVQQATGEIASGVTDLSVRTDHQASSLEETAASMEQLAQTVRQNADNAQEANKLAKAARQSATSGSEIALKAVDAIDKIEGGSRRISEIVGLIQEIAFQTNLLALNAAVEAARAGDAGRGFAVVAHEVRALAERAAQASKDIKQLIASTELQVKDGVNLVKQAGGALHEISTSVVKVADFVSEIATASAGQAAGIDQVSRAINGMDNITQQNAALVEGTNAALQSAQTQIDDLRRAVSKFKTDKQRADAALDIPSIAPKSPEYKAVARHPIKPARPAPLRKSQASAAAALNTDWIEF